MKFDGGCHCGKIKYSVEIDPAAVQICHCTDCQVLSGGPFSVSAPAASGTLAFTRGEVTTYIKTAESGRKRAHGLCNACGTRIYSASVGDATTSYMIRVTTLDRGSELAPVRQIWARSALPWLEDLAGMETVDRG